MTSRRPTVVDLFCGAGGMSLGFEQAGFDVVLGVERDPVHATVHHHNFPNCRTLVADLADATWSTIIEASGMRDLMPDVVVGGPPCVGISSIGPSDPSDPRNDLMVRFALIATQSGAGHIVMENVAPLTQDRNRHILERVVRVLEEAGYRVRTPVRIHDAMDHGVPQTRRRIFLLAARADLVLPAYPQPVLGYPSVEDAIDDLPAIDDIEELRSSDRVRLSWSTRSIYARRLRGLDADPEDFSYARDHDPDLLTASERTEHDALIVDRFASIPNGTIDPVGRYYKLDRWKPCMTIRAGSANGVGNGTVPRPIHYDRPRCITVREAARIHGYPDWFEFSRFKRVGFQQVGNSVPPPMARAVARSVVEALGVSPVRPSDVLVRGEAGGLSVKDRKRSAEAMRRMAAAHGQHGSVLPDLRLA